MIEELLICTVFIQISQVTLLMSDRRKMATLYVEEKRRSDELATILRDEKNKVKVS